MANKVTSKRVAKIASSLLRKKRVSRRVKSVAGSGLSQAERRRKRKSK
ncbi:MAG: hypothetical protein KBD73_02180 [Candidatus Magasanikbacteria bacterium]|nr:hypothetical protein [Candidatus Magasanikbacteria bacterium]